MLQTSDVQICSNKTKIDDLKNIKLNMIEMLQN
jgi:hypothetical protein